MADEPQFITDREALATLYMACISRLSPSEREDRGLAPLLDQIGRRLGVPDAPRLVRSRWPKTVGRDTVDLTALPDPVEMDGDEADGVMWTPGPLYRKCDDPECGYHYAFEAEYGQPHFHYVGLDEPH